ncbi:uncharacterized protein LOC113282008 isoform X2 [Papaver somniferum]|uniref:uncharacterized protein LOC113282008 isoform X2 n=1 Tax=Papaver somniferum TaxID=3469 RepID=UPI000E702673|nr:uncharacterized protein LOC113282008 isoform X2 [Papaver somniferum]
MDAIKTIDTLKPYTQRRLYFRFGRRKSSISLSSAGHHQFYLHKLVHIVLYRNRNTNGYHVVCHLNIYLMSPICELHIVINSFIVFY